MLKCLRPGRAATRTLGAEAGHLAFSVSGGPDGGTGPMHQGHDDDAATAGDAGPPSTPSGTPAPAKSLAGGQVGGAASRGRC